AFGRMIGPCFAARPGASRRTAPVLRRQSPFSPINQSKLCRRDDVYDLPLRARSNGFVFSPLNGPGGTRTPTHKNPESLLAPATGPEKPPPCINTERAVIAYWVQRLAFTQNAHALRP